MNNWSFYDNATGLLLDLAYTGDEALLRQNTPAGAVAIQGYFNRLNKKVDVVSGSVIDWKPEAPIDSALLTWSWNAKSKLWDSAPTTAAIAVNMRAERDGRLRACDWVVIKSTEENKSVSTDWTVYRKALRDLTGQIGFPEAIVWPVHPAL